MNVQLHSLKKFLMETYEITLCRIYGESLHPGGLQLTQRIGKLGGMTSRSLVLDIGSGTGSSAFSIAESFGCSIIGIDFSKRLVKMGKSRFAKNPAYRRLTFILGDAECLPFQDSSFDVVFCECAFNLFPNKEKVLQEIKRILREDGKLILSDFALKNELSEHQKDKLTFALCIAGAEISEKLLEWIRKAGFSDIYVEDHTDKLLPFAVQILLNSDVLEPENMETLENLFYDNALSYLLIVASKNPNDNGEGSRFCF